MESLLAAAMQLGVGGLFAVLFFWERKDRIRAESEAEKSRTKTISIDALNRELLEVVKANTAAMASLRVSLVDLKQTGNSGR